MNVPEEKLYSILYPTFTRQIEDINRTKNITFAYYTSAETVVNILKGNCIYMRNASLMNDYMEVSYGVQLIENYFSNTNKYNELIKHLKDIYSELSEKTHKEFIYYVLRQIRIMRNHLYMTCLSEHDLTNDATGKLSMWRAYGGKTGCSIVFNRDLVLKIDTDPHVNLSKVEYLNQDSFDSKADEIIKNIGNNISFLKNIPLSVFREKFAEMLLMASCCIKNPGFKEENEWRIFYLDTNDTAEELHNSLLDRQDVCLNGIPQKIYRLHLDRLGYYWLDHIIIGPTQYAYPIWEYLRRKVGPNKVKWDETSIRPDCI